MFSEDEQKQINMLSYNMHSFQQNVHVVLLCMFLERHWSCQYVLLWYFKCLASWSMSIIAKTFVISSRNSEVFCAKFWRIFFSLWHIQRYENWILCIGKMRGWAVISADLHCTPGVLQTVKSQTRLCALSLRRCKRKWFLKYRFKCVENSPVYIIYFVH